MRQNKLKGDIQVIKFILNFCDGVLKTSNTLIKIKLNWLCDCTKNKFFALN